MGGVSEGKRYSGCIRCMCWCYCLLFLLIAIAAGLAYYIYTTEKPKPPTYDVQSFTVRSFEFHNLTLKTEFMVNVKTKNPNKNIRFEYGEKSNVSVLYNEAIISSGKLPAFTQDPANTTIVKIALAGTSMNVTDTFQHDMKGGKNYEGIPLVINVKVPMKIYVGTFGLKEFIAFVTCEFTVDDLKSGKMAKVLQNECEPDLEFW